MYITQDLIKRRLSDKRIYIAGKYIMRYTVIRTPVYTLLYIRLYVIVNFITLMFIFDKNDSLVDVFDLLLSEDCVIFFEAIYIITRYRTL